MGTITKLLIVAAVLIGGVAIYRWAGNTLAPAISEGMVLEPTLQPDLVEKVMAEEVATATALPTPSATPMAEVVVDLKSLDMKSIIDALSNQGMVVYNRQLFGDSWVTKSGPVSAKLPDGYNVLVISSDSASVENGKLKFGTKAEGFLAVIVNPNSQDFVINNIGYNAESGHRNVSAYALKVDASGEELQNFALNLATFEWSKEHKPIMFFADGVKVIKANASTVKDMTSKEEMRTTISNLLSKQK
jgi:hypothetical protein